MENARISASRPGILLVAAMAMLSLSACSRGAENQQDGAAPEPGETAAPGPQATISPPESSVTPPAAPHATGAIPQALRGRWGLVVADCTSVHGDAKGLMEVGATTLTFYESRATLKSIHAAQPGRLRADYAFSGEGQDWTQDIELRTWNNGAQLIRQDRGPDALPGPLTYTRCGA